MDVSDEVFTVLCTSVCAKFKNKNISFAWTQKKSKDFISQKLPKLKLFPGTQRLYRAL